MGAPGSNAGTQYEVRSNAAGGAGSGDEAGPAFALYSRILAHPFLRSSVPPCLRLGIHRQPGCGAGAGEPAPASLARARFSWGNPCFSPAYHRGPPEWRRRALSFTSTGMMTKTLCAAVLLAGLGVPLATRTPPLRAQQPAGERLTVEEIFGGSTLSPDRFEMAGWLGPDRLTFIERDSASGVHDLWAADATTGRRTLLLKGAALVPEGSTQPIDMEQVRWSADQKRILIYTNSQKVWRQRTKGIYWVYDFDAKSLTPVSTRPGWQMFAKFSPSGDRVAFVRDRDLWVTDLATGAETRLTTSGERGLINGTFDWAYEEELDLRDGWRWSPDGKRIAFWQLDPSEVRDFFLISLDSLYPRLDTIPYPKAGERNSTARVGVVPAGGGDVTWMQTGDDPDVYLARMDWAASPSELVIQRMNRHQNRIDVLLADAATGAVRTLLSDTDSAWVDVDDDLTWIRGGRQLVWSSEKDGWNHLYLYDRSGKLVRKLTPGPWEVTAFYGIDPSEKWAYYQGTAAGPTERQIYRVPLAGGSPQRLTEEPGTHSAAFGPHMRYAVETFSAFGTPPVYRLDRADGTVVRTLLDNGAVRRRLAAHDLGSARFFRLPTPRGDTLNAWMIRPPDFDASKTYPVLMYVYGGPGSQMVTDAWGGDRWLWHEMMAEKGYVVVSVDNRGTGARGRDFKKQTYLDLGALEAADQVAAARWIGSQPWADASRIGIWGWSYGGYMTLVSLESGGSVFRTGLAVAPVTDWHFYDSIYTERFMRTPEENPEGYLRSAPLKHVDRIDSDLLLVHGTGDDNVHVQNSYRLIDAMVAADIPFDLMIYPGRTHAISEKPGTRVHLYQKMTAWLDTHLAMRENGETGGKTPR